MNVWYCSPRLEYYSRFTNNNWRKKLIKHLPGEISWVESVLVIVVVIIVSVVVVFISAI